MVSTVLAMTVGITDLAPAQEGLRPFAVVGDAIPAPLTGAKGDPARGRAIVANRQVGLCLLCHTGPFPEEKFQGTLAPDLAGAGTRWSEGELRLRIVDAARLNPATIMPPKKCKPRWPSCNMRFRLLPRFLHRIHSASLRAGL